MHSNRPRIVATSFYAVHKIDSGLHASYVLAGNSEKVWVGIVQNVFRMAHKRTHMRAHTEAPFAEEYTAVHPKDLGSKYGCCGCHDV